LAYIFNKTKVKMSSSLISREKKTYQKIKQVYNLSLTKIVPTKSYVYNSLNFVKINVNNQ